MSGQDWSNRHYVVMSNPQPQEAWDSPGIWGTAATERLSLDESLVVMKWEGATPPYFARVETYSHAEILAILRGPDWTPPHPEPEEEDAPPG